MTEVAVLRHALLRLPRFKGVASACIFDHHGRQHNSLLARLLGVLLLLLRLDGYVDGLQKHILILQLQWLISII